MRHQRRCEDDSRREIAEERRTGIAPAGLELVLSRAIGEIHIESMLEAARIAEITARDVEYVHDTCLREAMI